MRELFISFYFFLLFIVAFYGIQVYWLVYLYLRHRNRPHLRPKDNLARPMITVQLPVYNEKAVVARLIQAVARFDWPTDKLEIQVLDDSDDVTSSLIEKEVVRLRHEGIRVYHIRRSNRDGFKAGALENGLATAQGDFIAVFDADNLPYPDFLKQLMPYLSDSSVGLVQARWSFLNRDESLLCRAQALFLDAHFHIEQMARSRGDLPMNFNGTAGIWRRVAIDKAGGWQFDTLTEDLDLSYRAQLAGYRFLFIDDVEVPTELPSSIRAFKTQQYRWARGAVETGLKLLPSIWRSLMPLRSKVAASFHLTQKSVAVALMLLSIMLVPALYLRMEGGAWKLLVIDLPIFLAGAGSMSLFYGLAYRRGCTEKDEWSKLVLPLLTSLGIGLSVNNTLALMGALFGRRRRFVRTPKSGQTGNDRTNLPAAYTVSFDHTIWMETILAVYAVCAVGCAVDAGLLASVPFLLTFVFGYSYYSIVSIRERHA
jgi:cellulose synthase/poly-beta-1,6-N-acetylglucosamine synthase-like glycosyltransferase